MTDGVEFHFSGIDKEAGTIHAAAHERGYKHSVFTAGLRILVATVALSCNAAGAADSASEPFSVSALRSGKSSSREACAAETNAVWVEHAHGDECICYYPSEGLDRRDTSRIAVVFFHGDHLDGTTPLGNYDRISPATLRRTMQDQYRRYGIPFILIARPGVYGSSGDHRQRRRAKEFHSLDAAVDAIKQRYGLQRIVIAGQSGGSTVGSALLTLGRKDVACAVLGSGNYDVLELAEIKRAKLNYHSRHGCDVTGYCDPYSPIDHIAGIAADLERRIAIVGDPQDNNTVFPLQRKFAEAVRAAGHVVELVEADGRGPDRHSMSHVTYRLAGLCAAAIAAGKPASSLRFDAAARLPAHAYSVPLESGFARIDDVDAVPVGDKGKPRYEHYLTLPAPKAFVVTEKGGWFFHSGSEYAMQKALDYCPAGLKCWLYAVDDRVVWRAEQGERISRVEPLDLVGAIAAD